jgi:hypothetical protein
MAQPFLMAYKFFEVAKKGFTRAQYNPWAKALNYGGQYDVLVAITFSVMTVEAFLNELIELSRDREEPDAQSLFSLLTQTDLNRKQKQLEDRLFRASSCNSDILIAKGNGIHQQFKLLVDIRNAIVHLLAGDALDDGLKQKHKTILEQLKKYKISSVNQSIYLHKEDEDLTREPEYNSIIDPTHLSFITLIATEDVAKWSYKVVSEVITAFVDGMGESTFKIFLKDCTNGRFQEPSQNDLDELLELQRIFVKFKCCTSDDFLAKVRKQELIVSIPTDV